VKSNKVVVGSIQTSNWGTNAYRMFWIMAAWKAKMGG
jgi:hypothetical protein